MSHLVLLRWSVPVLITTGSDRKPPLNDSPAITRCQFTLSNMQAFHIHSIFIMWQRAHNKHKVCMNVCVCVHLCVSRCIFLIHPATSWVTTTPAFLPTLFPWLPACHNGMCSCLKVSVCVCLHVCLITDYHIPNTNMVYMETKTSAQNNVTTIKQQLFYF